jgi:hypothetical protein
LQILTKFEGARSYPRNGLSIYSNIESRGNFSKFRPKVGPAIDAFRVVAHQTAEKLKTSHSFEYHALNNQSESQNSQSNANGHELLQTICWGV